jgi:pentatricopeptide repeat protein
MLLMKDIETVKTLVAHVPHLLTQVHPTYHILPFMLAGAHGDFLRPESILMHHKVNFAYSILRKDPSVIDRVTCCDPESRLIQALQRQLKEAHVTIKKQHEEIATLKASQGNVPRKVPKTGTRQSLPPGSGTMLMVCLVLGLSTFLVAPSTALLQQAYKIVDRTTRQPPTLTQISVALDTEQTSSSLSHSSDRRIPRPFTSKEKALRNRQMDPDEVEAAVNSGLDALSILSDFSPVPLFPPVRQCNSALSAFGDQGDLLRALRMFGKMRKAAYVQRSIQRELGVDIVVPTPTLVTYSTLMSRAVRAGKPHVALRLWKMMPSSIEPDVKSINILLNCYAKLGNADMAKTILNEMEQEPNLVTFNTVLKACQKVGDLDSALEIKKLMEELSVRPDVWTYTTLLATVARGKSRSSGERDPTIALHLLQEMHKWKVYPNGMTYSAFIEACGRCNRVDLALQGLRVMQRQKDREKQRRGLDLFTLSDEVGAWTSAINVCGKAGRWETAVKLFSTMKKLGCAPNTVTCGCLADSLLRCGRTAETLGVLRYMKKEGILPTEVMYTSLMTRADSLIQMENEFKPDHPDVAEESGAKAIEVYTELMMSLMETGEIRTAIRSPKYLGAETDSNTRLLKVFLVFQQMKAAGAEPDLACFNVLLRACASAGDVARGWDVLRQIQSSPRLEPNDRSWRELLRAAATAGDAKKAETVWKYGLSYHLQHPRYIDEPEWKWKPSINSLQNLLVAYSRQADMEENEESRRDLYERVVQTYDGILMGERHMGLQRIDPMDMLDDRRTILIIVRAILSLRPLVDATRLVELQDTGRSLIQLNCLHEDPPLNPPAERLVYLMRTWTSV